MNVKPGESRFWNRVSIGFIAGMILAAPAGAASGDASGDHDQNPPFSAWAYDPGPSPQDPMGKELIDLTAAIPNFPGISEALTGDQKFRPAYGPIPWRMLQKPNSVKILFIGQDGTHIAEAANRPATAGFGGRAQDLAKYFGVTYSAAFINTYAFTIRGQYGTFETPIVTTKKDGTRAISLSSYTDPYVWLMTQDPESPITQWRNRLIDWIIRNNRDSLQMIVMFGGAARDAMGSYIISKGGTVGSRYDETDLSKVRVPELELQPLFQNFEAAVPRTASGGDLFEKVLGRRLNYRDQEKADLSAATSALTQTPAKWIPEMVFSQGGVAGSGLIHPAQLGGYDVDEKTVINGKKTISLKGLKISSDLTLDRDVLVVELPHPTALSMMSPPAASDAVKKKLEGLKDYPNWRIAPDVDSDEKLENLYAKGEPYRYRRADMGPEYYDFGAPKSRMVNRSDAVRNGPNVIVFGTREKDGFDAPSTQQLLREMADTRPERLPDPQDLFTTRPQNPQQRYTFDPGPGVELAKLMKENLPQALIDDHEVNGDFGHYRGTWKNPRALVIADPAGYDDLITGRALTGSRGQYLHGLLSDLGLGDQYLVIKTAPFAQEADWNKVVEQTRKYREAILSTLAKTTRPEVILVDGETAQAEVNRIWGSKAPAPIITLDRKSGKPDSGIVEAASRISQLGGRFAQARVTKARMADLPRTHLPFYSRLWEGTSGDRVITSPEEKFKGKAFAVVVPNWAARQERKLTPQEANGVDQLLKKIDRAGLRRANESVPNFLKRIRSSGQLGALSTSSPAHWFASTPACSINDAA